MFVLGHSLTEPTAKGCSQQAHSRSAAASLMSARYVDRRPADVVTGVDVMPGTGDAGTDEK